MCVCAFAHPSLNLKSPFFNHNGRGLLKILRRSLGISDFLMKPLEIPHGTGFCKRKRTND